MRVPNVPKIDEPQSKELADALAENARLRKELELAELRAENAELKRKIMEKQFPYNPYNPLSWGLP